MKISSTGGAQVTLSGPNLAVLSQGTIGVQAGLSMDIRSGSDLTAQAGGNLTLKSQAATDVRSGTSLNVQAASNLALKAAATATLQSGSTTAIQSSGNIAMQGGGVLSLVGGLVALNGDGGCTPAARITDAIPGVDTFTGQVFLSALAPGSSTVCVGG